MCEVVTAAILVSVENQTVNLICCGLFAAFFGSSLLQVVRVDLSSVKCCCSGPKRPLDRVDIVEVKTDFLSCLQDVESRRVSHQQNVITVLAHQADLTVRWLDD